MLILSHISVHVLEIEKRSAFIEISIYRIYQHLLKSVKRNISLKIRNHEKICFFMAAVQGHFFTISFNMFYGAFDYFNSETLTVRLTGLEKTYHKSGSYVCRTDLELPETGLTLSELLLISEITSAIFEACSRIRIFCSALGIIHFGKKYCRGYLITQKSLRDFKFHLSYFFYSSVNVRARF